MLDLPARSERGADRLALTFPDAVARQASAPGLAPSIGGFGLTARVLAVTIGFVLLAMGLFYVTRLTAHREILLRGKISAVQTTVGAFGMAGPTPPSHDLSQKILNSIDVKWMAIETPAGEREFVVAGGLPAGVESIMADDNSYLGSMAATFHALFAAPGTVVKLSAPAQASEPAIEFAFDEASVVQSLRRVSCNFLTISLTIAAVVTCVLWAALWRMVLQPVRRLTSNIIAFGESPQDASRVIAPSSRRNEIGRAEAALAVMQGSLAHELAQGKRLAELGMAVARINHDLRNILSAAQLISDRLATIPDPLAQDSRRVWLRRSIARSSSASRRSPMARAGSFPLSPPLRSERAGEPSRRVRGKPSTRSQSTTTSTFRLVSVSMRTRTTFCGCLRT